MSMIMILIPLSLLLVAVAVWAFFWAVNSGQFDDLETPAWEILTDAAVPAHGDPLSADKSANSVVEH